MSKIIIDAENAIFGRVCSYAAKKALEGNDIVVVNANKVIVTGNRADLIGKYNDLKRKGGHSLKGPKYIANPQNMMKRSIRGMLPDHRVGQGRVAFKRVMCYNEVPEEFKGKEMQKVHTEKKIKYITLKELSQRL